MKKNQDIARLIKKAKKIKNEIAIKRDRLREVTDDLEFICQDLDEAEQTIESGIDLIQEGVEKISQQL